MIARIGKLIVAAMCAVAAAGGAGAHRVGIPVTSIDWNARQSIWEVVHRVSAHDLDAAFGSARTTRMLETEAGLSELGNYCAQNFSVEGQGLTINFLGAELEGDDVYIYFELSAPDQVLLIDSNLLSEAGQTVFAHVNVDGAAGVESYIFGHLDGPRKVALERPL
jgi:hypothetical protein